MPLKDYYKILGVPKTASAKDIKLAYYALVKKLHPDNGSDPKRTVAEFKEVVEAYNILGNLDNRLLYSIQLNQNSINRKLKNQKIEIPGLKLYSK